MNQLSEPSKPLNKMALLEGDPRTFLSFWVLISVRNEKNAKSLLKVAESLASLRTRHDLVLSNFRLKKLVLAGHKEQTYIEQGLEFRGWEFNVRIVA